MTEKEIQEFMAGEQGKQIGQMIANQFIARMKEEQNQKRRNFEVLNQYAQEGAIVFTGSSLMEQFPINEIALSDGITKTIYNRGIGGTTSDDFLSHIETVTLAQKHPSKLFLNIGTNDMTDAVYGDKWPDHLEENYEKILTYIKNSSPQTMVYAMAYYPTNRSLPGARENSWQWSMLKDRSPENIAECNRRVHALADKYGYIYIDVNGGLFDENGEQKAEFAIDGVHMWASAYEMIYKNLKTYL